MVEVVDTGFLAQMELEGGPQEFPETELVKIKSAIEQVPATVFEDSAAGDEVNLLDMSMADRLPEYEYEGPYEGNAACQLWSENGYGYSVDFYHPEHQIAIEVEKSERKYLWKDLVKFSRGDKDRAGREEENQVWVYRRSGELQWWRKHLPGLSEDSRFHAAATVRRGGGRHRIPRSAINC